MSHEESSHYRRLLAPYAGGLQDAMCVTYARGVDEDAFIRAFGGDPARTVSLRSRDPDPERPGGLPMILLVTRVGDWLVGIEENGFQGSRPEVMRAASAGGPAVSVYWCVHAAAQFTYRERGRPVVSFDLWDAERRWGPEPEALGDLMSGLPFEFGQGGWAGLALAERFTGIRLDEEILGRVFRRALLTQVPEDLVPENMMGHPALDDPFVRAVVAEPTRDKLPGVTALLAGLLAEHGGIGGEPAVRDALALLAERADGGRADATEVRRRMDALVEAAGRERPRNAQDLMRLHAIQGVRNALNDDPARASRELISSGGYILSGDAGVVRLVLDRCRARALRAPA
ncbi:DUF6461 domain-containing protein [Micromonospora sp. CPCC 205711]|uniref:DUF6461 domain-containing protein n=1 Tax=Micromonospora sp. CPCC 205547 TaxID=3122400 RepID=UPI002FF3BC3E